MAIEDLFLLRIANAAGKDLLDLPPKQYKQVVSKILSLVKNPRPNDSKKLKNFDGEGYRATQGEYRILYTIDEASKVIDVFRVGKRNGDEVYRNL